MFKRLKYAKDILFTAVLFLILLCCTFCKSDQKNFWGIISAGTPEAAKAGRDILQAGGNAADAAVAVSFVLAVTEPAMTGLGAQTQILIHSQKKDPVVINGTSFSPRLIPADLNLTDIKGRRAATIPSMVKTLGYFHKRYGSGKLSWRELIEPAIKYALNGFAISPFRHKVLSLKVKELLEDPAARKFYLNEDGTVPALGTVWKQPVLAQTLIRLAESGADDFYKGKIALDIAADMKENGGWVTLDDLKSLPNPAELVPLKSTYRGYDVYTLPPPGGGWVILQVLNLLGKFPSSDLLLNSEERLLLLAESLQIGHQNRCDYPVRDLTQYEEEVSYKIAKETAARLMKRESRSGETTHFSIVDRDGMGVSVTTSINYYYGSKVANPRLGFLYNDYMREYEFSDSAHPFAIKPNAMPYSSMSPTIIAKDGKPVLVLGSPGSARIISAIVQVIQLWVDGGITIQNALAEKRLHVIPTRELFFESDNIPEKILFKLVQNGFSIEQPDTEIMMNGLNPYFGGVNAVALENGRWVGAADPRRDGEVEY